MPNQIGNFSVYNYDEVKPSVLSFRSQNHLLLGNGFSSSLLAQIFSYSALRQHINTDQFTIGTRIQNIFRHIGSDDFEEVVRRLNISEPIANEYGVVAGPMSVDCNILKNELIAAIGSTHPAHPWEGITNDNYQACHIFLKRFSSIYTLNYDLLLYWVINRTRLISKFRDGFTRVSEPRGLPLVWNGERQNIFHLHGGLHLYKILWDANTPENFEAFSGYDYVKLDNVSQSNNLIDQIQQKINQKIYPITVSEGDPASKKKKILSERILRHAYFNFKKLTGSLYTFGVGLDKNQDNHLIDAIEVSSLSEIYIGVYRPTHQILLDTKAKFDQVNYQRSQKGLSNIKISFYDTSLFSIWQRTI